MPFHEPFTLGPFSVDAEGQLSLMDPIRPPGFSVRWRERVIHARLTQSGAGSGDLHIHATLGRVPSTVPDPAARLSCLSLIRDLMVILPETWTLRLPVDHQPRVEARTTVVLPVSVTTLLTEMTAFLISLTPYLDLMDAAGIHPVE